MSESEAQRAIHDAIESQAPDMGGRAGLLTAWVVVGEWHDDEGESWLTKIATYGTTQWHIDGMLHYALYRFGTPQSEDDEDD